MMNFYKVLRGFLSKLPAPKLQHLVSESAKSKRVNERLEGDGKFWSDPGTQDTAEKRV